MTGGAATAKRMDIMNKILLPAAFAALFILAACDNEPEVINTNPDPMANQLAAAPPVEMPPSVSASHSYRCADNSVVFVDFLSDDRSANIRLDRSDMPTHVVAAAPGEPMTAEGFSLSGSGEEVQIAVNGGAAQTCSR